jgi:hypothetical protein
MYKLLEHLLTIEINFKNITSSFTRKRKKDDTQATHGQKHNNWQNSILFHIKDFF